MKPNVACTTAVLALLLAGTTVVTAQRDYRSESLDLLRLLADKPFIGLGPHNRWDRAPRIELDIGAANLEPHSQALRNYENKDYLKNYVDDDIRRMGSEKRSAVATALNSGRRRRQPTPALGKAVTPYVGVGVLNDVGSFFDSLRDNLETLASLSPQQRSTLFQDPPTVVQAPSAGGGGGGTGMRRLHALRPLRPTGNIRSYNRRSFVEADGGYPGANHHDPGLLWTGLGR
ncbi:uncharacterized protein LOC131841026 isoform X2 [Achroia grisella]|uniref:uncharacterized protein LOC131841026 isoform X2 n=1 Tax=Achroia grisella TaxID=688607 RepID=UPI0027D1F270|nr:uncharacterized protein LOC131841026 isoform X2 [Achroia grisella]